MDPTLRGRVFPLVEWLFDHYWRVTVEGGEHLPTEGPVLLIGNHSGTLPFDGAMICVAAERASGRVFRPLYDRFVDGFGVVGAALQALGGVTASYASASALLERNEAVLLFPEGIGGVSKPFAERYQLAPFASSAARLALELEIPIVPFGLVGAEESSPLIAKSQLGADRLGVPYLPLTAGALVAGPLGLLPLPTKWSLRFGRRIYLHRERRFRDRADVEGATQKLRGAVAGQLARQLAGRRSVLTG